MAEQDNPVFYKLVNSVTGHYYLGATSTPIGRERDHLKNIRLGRKPKLWQQMWNDHPQTRNVAVWRMHIVRCYPDMASAVRCEHAFLQARVGNDPMCLNHLRTPNNVVSPSTGRKVSDDIKARISDSMSVLMSGDNHPTRGKRLSDEHVAKIAAANTGKKRSAESRSKMRESKLGEKNPMYGKTVSADTRSKMSAAHSGEGNPFYGKTHSPETRAKMKAAAKLREARKRAEKEAAKSSQ